MIDTYIWNQRWTTKKLLSQITTDDKYRSIFKEDIEALLDIRRNMSSNWFIANKVIYQQFILIIKKHAIAIFNAKLLKNKTLEKERSALSKTQKNPTTP